MGACFSSASAAPAGAAERRPSKEDKKGRRGGASPEGAAKAAAAAPVRVEFGYTFAATDRQSGDRVAVKRIDKTKVSSPGCRSTSLRGLLWVIPGAFVHSIQ